MISVLMCMCCTFFLFISCSKDLDVLEPADKGGMTEIQLKNGMLVFPNGEALGKVLSGKENVQLNQFVERFTSQKDMMDAIIKAEQENMAHLDTLEGEALEIADKHSELYYKCLESGLIRQEFYSDGSSSYNLNLAVPLYSKIVNKEGYFAVGDTIYQVTSKYKKVWIGGDLNNYKLLDTYTETDEAKNICVIDYTQKATGISNSGLSRTNFPISINDQNVGMYIFPDTQISNNLRLAFIFYDRTTPIFARKSYLRDTYCRVICQRPIKGSKPVQYGYSPEVYDYSFGVYILIDGVEKRIISDGTGTGSNDYYAVYTMYQMIAAGHDPQEFDGEYYQISRFDCKYYWVKQGEGALSGTIASAIVGLYMEQGPTVLFKYYFQPYQGDGHVGNGYWLNEIIPD